MIKNKKITAVICEFNPLHKGHKHLLNKMRENSLVVCVMSGNFVQRGDLAIIDKWQRTKMALACGADLVIELPLSIATSNAETFSFGAVEIINSLGIVDELHFGSECGDTKRLKEIVDLLGTEEYQKELKINLSKGISFATAREITVSSLLNCYNEELKGSNNNLAIEYMKALNSLNSNIKPVTIKRIGAGHDEISSGDTLSAMQIRGMIKTDDKNIYDNIPEEGIEILKNSNGPYLISKLETAILCKLRSLSIEDLRQVPDISEGLENRLFSAIKKAVSIEELISLTKTKRYTHARIRRIILHAFLGVNKDMQKNAYVRILGFNRAGKEIISKSNKTLPILGKASDINKFSEFAKSIFELECMADDIYALATEKKIPCGLDYTMGIIIKD